MNLIAASESDTIALNLKDGSCGTIVLRDGDKYLGYFEWTPNDGLFFYSKTLKGDTLELYGDKDEGYKQEVSE
jgi:hypothetical protein